MRPTRPLTDPRRTAAPATRRRPPRPMGPSAATRPAGRGARRVRPATPPSVATADLTVISLGRAEVSASRYIAEIQRRLAAQDRVRHLMHAMGTSLEGETADILALVAELHAVPFELGIPRVYTVLKLDERRDAPQTLESKVASVQRLLDEPPAAGTAVAMTADEQHPHPQHNPGEFEFGEHSGDAPHNPGEPEFGQEPGPEAPAQERQEQADAESAEGA